MKTEDASSELCLPTITAELEMVSRWDMNAASFVKLTDRNYKNVFSSSGGK